MSLDLGLGAGVAALVLGFPVFLLLLIAFLGRLEAWMLMPDERAEAVSKLLDQVHETEELERAVAVMMAEVADRPRGRRERKADRRRAMRIVRRRRRAAAAAAASAPEGPPAEAQRS